MKKEGLLLKGISGFYYVQTDDGIIECHARGLFRKEKITPLAGDIVECEVDNGKGTVIAVCQRKNYLIRPPVANLDQMIIVSSMAEPAPNALLIDKMAAIAEIKKIEPVIVFTKTDLQFNDMLFETYQKAGFSVLRVSSLTGEGVDRLKSILLGKLSTFTGNSGVGKSSLLNQIIPGLGLATGEISHKLGRGRHTTRHVELYPLKGGGYIADTPGFSSLDIERFEKILKDDLPFAFREFAPYLSQCRFNGCTHVKEKGCAVIEAVEKGEIPRLRYESYVSLYNEVKNIREWE